MKNTHEFLRDKFEWYKRWDDHKYSYHFHWAFLVLFLIGVIFGLVLQIWLLPPDISQASASTSMNFTSSGTQDGGAVTYFDGAHTWMITLPSNVAKVETAHYDPNDPGVVKKYMGWNGYLKVNGTKIWEFKSWSSETGGLIYDHTLGQEVKESAGDGLWIDVTDYMEPGINTMTYYHFTGGDGIGLRVKVETNGEISYCGDGSCDSDEDCSTCFDDCKCSETSCCSPDSLSYTTSYGCVLNGSETTSGKICCNGVDYIGNCCDDSDCSSGYECSNHSCVKLDSQKIKLGEQCFIDSDCDSGNCANKYRDHLAGLCMPNIITSNITININHIDQRENGTGITTTGLVRFRNSNGKSSFDNFYSSADWKLLQWDGYFCDQNVYRYEASSKYYYKVTDGTNYWYGEINKDSIESVMTNAFEDMICKTVIEKKDDGSSCTIGSECLNEYCVHNKCRSSSTYCGDGYCDSDEDCDCIDCSSQEGCQEETHIIDIISTVNTAEQGMGNEIVDIIYSKDYWDFNQERSPLTHEILQQTTGLLKQSLEKFDFNIGGIEAEMDEENYTLTYKFDYFNYVVKGEESGASSKYNDKWVIPLTRGEFIGAKNICQLDNFKFDISGLRALISFDYKNKFANEKYRAQKTINLPNSAQNINLDERECLISYDIKSDEEDLEDIVIEEPEVEIVLLKKDGQSCSQNADCQSNNCLKNFCRPVGYTYCGDEICQDNEWCDCRDCKNAPKCQKPNFNYTVNVPSDIKAGGKNFFEIEINNKGKDTLTDVELRMYLGRNMKYLYSKCEGKEPCIIEVDDIGPGQKIKVPASFTEFVYEKPVEESIVQFYLKTSNSTQTEWKDIKREVEVKAEAITLLADLSKTSVTGEQGGFKKVKLRLSTNNNWGISRNNIKVKIKSDKEEIATVSVSPSFSEKEYLLIDSLDYNNPKTVTFYIDFQKIGYTNLNIEVEGDNIERIYKNIPVEVMARPPVLEFATSTSGLIMEEDEEREIFLTLKNTGTGLAYQPEVEIDYNKDMIMVLGTSLPIHFDSIEPGESMTRTIIFNARKSGNVKIDFIANYALEPASSKDHINYKFKNTKKINLAIEEEKKVCQDDECTRQVDCLIEVSNLMGCGLEVADVIPYFDKPTAVVLATSDFCDIKERAEDGDPIGSSVTALLATVDIGDNAGEAVPVAGNVASALIDTIEGAADCMEGFVYDTVDEYCASESDYGGYSGCFDNIATKTAYYTGQATDAANSISTAIFGMFGSPVSFRIVDDNGLELGPQDGVLIIEQGELKTFLIKNPNQLENGYDIELMGMEDGTYHLHTALISNGEVIGNDVISGREVKRAESQKIALNVAQTKEGEITKFQVADKNIKVKTDKIISKLPKIEFTDQRILFWVVCGLVLTFVLVIGFILMKRRG